LSSRPPYVSKRIEERTEKQKRKRAIRTKPTKAELRRRFASKLRRLVEDLRGFDKLRTAAGRERRVRACLVELEACIEEKPQCHVLRVQRHLCLEALQELASNPSEAMNVELQRPLTEPEGMRLALKGRLRVHGVGR
jgi:hypothetical protein